ncbi:hypothetical protein D3Y59_03865 [Hymenobacter oligotrophus]|uniref:Uncharacterized protein n=1 Tax=Hymenobacter oligotrophus TaxID=2319843 RepID=A0A3B7QWT5_9BACT|nr:hypothetical protein [Hymenobacter oligotrophus]AYA36274.1 hypothetical protein D3Y59_03865 [Hymenobacter oligotrophus]
MLMLNYCAAKQSSGWRILLIGLWLLLGPGLRALGQQAAPGPQPADTVVTSITARHVRVPGSTFYVRKTPDYVAEESLNGLVKSNGALLEVLRIPQSNFLNVKDVLVQQYLAKAGRIGEQRQLLFNGYPAVFGEGESIEPGKSLMVLGFGDTTSIMLVFGLYENADQQSAAELKQMLLTGWFDPKGTIPPLELAPFVVQLAGTPFQLQQVRNEGKLYVFGPAAKSKTEPLPPQFTVQVLPPTGFENLRPELQSSVQQRTTTGAVIKTEERQVSAQPVFVYEISGSSSYQNRRSTFHQVIKTDGEATLVFDGVTFGAPAAAAATAPRNKAKSGSKLTAPAAPDYAAALKKIADSLRMKR